MSSVICTYTSNDCDPSFIRKTLIAARMRLSEVLYRNRKKKGKLLRSPHDRCLQIIDKQIEDVLKHNCFYAICDPLKSKGELSEAVNCAVEKFSIKVPKVRCADALIQGRHFILLIIEETDNERKTESKLTEQVQKLFAVVEGIVDHDVMVDWLNKCTRKPKRLTLNPMHALRNNERNWRDCGGLAIGLVKAKPPSIRTFHSLLVHGTSRVFETRPYIMIMTKGERDALYEKATRAGLSKYFPATY